MDTGEGQESPSNAPAPLPLSGIAARFPRHDRYSQQMWLTLASYMAGNSFTATQAQAVADEVEHRFTVMDCSYAQAIASVWDDIKAGRWRPRDH